MTPEQLLTQPEQWIRDLGKFILRFPNHYQNILIHSERKETQWFHIPRKNSLHYPLRSNWVGAKKKISLTKFYFSEYQFDIWVGKADSDIINLPLYILTRTGRLAAEEDPYNEITPFEEIINSFEQLDGLLRTLEKFS